MKVDELMESDELQKQAFAGSRKDEIAYLTRIGNQIRYRLNMLKASPTYVAMTTRGRGSVAPPPSGIEALSSKIRQLESKYSDITQKIRELTISGHSFCFTGFRDKEMEKTIERLGGRVVSSVSARTDFVIALDVDEKSGKLQKARELGTQVVSKGRMIQILRGDYMPAR